jgi:hypothetical protein
MTMALESAITTKDYLPLIGVVIGGALAVSGGFLSTWCLERRRHSLESRTLAYAFRGELLALISIVETRDYAGNIRGVIAEMERSNQPILFRVSVRRENSNVFKGNVNKIGVLKNPLPELVARFYVQANAILEDFEDYRDGSRSHANAAALLFGYKELLALMENTTSLSREIVSQIDVLIPNQLLKPSIGSGSAVTPSASAPTFTPDDKKILFASNKNKCDSPKLRCRVPRGMMRDN